MTCISDEFLIIIEQEPVINPKPQFSNTKLSDLKKGTTGGGFILPKREPDMKIDSKPSIPKSSKPRIDITKPTIGTKPPISTKPPIGNKPVLPVKSNKIASLMQSFQGQEEETSPTTSPSHTTPKPIELDRSPQTGRKFERKTSVSELKGKFNSSKTRGDETSRPPPVQHSKKGFSPTSSINKRPVDNYPSQLSPPSMPPRLPPKPPENPPLPSQPPLPPLPPLPPHPPPPSSPTPPTSPDPLPPSLPPVRLPPRNIPFSPPPVTDPPPPPPPTSPPPPSNMDSQPSLPPRPGQSYIPII